MQHLHFRFILGKVGTMAFVVSRLCWLSGALLQLFSVLDSTSGATYVGDSLRSGLLSRDEADWRFHDEQPFPVDNLSLYVDISNNMEQTALDNIINVDCIAESSHREPLEHLGHGTVKPKQAVIYYMNLRVFNPEIVSCTFEWAGRQKTLDLYDNRNLELQSKYVRWSVMENGFSLYHSVSERFHLYKTWS